MLIDCGESDKMIEIRGKVDKSDTYKGFSSSDIVTYPWYGYVKRT